jgi:hypothetical protein
MNRFIAVIIWPRRIFAKIIAAGAKNNPGTAGVGLADGKSAVVVSELRAQP